MSYHFEISSVNNLHTYLYMDRHLKLWSLGPSSLRSLSSANWRRRAAWRRRRRLKARSFTKSERSITAAWPRGRCDCGRKYVSVCKIWPGMYLGDVWAWLQCLICRRRWLLLKHRRSSWRCRRLRTVRGWLRTGRWRCSSYTRLACHWCRRKI